MHMHMSQVPLGSVNGDGESHTHGTFSLRGKELNLHQARKKHRTEPRLQRAGVGVGVSGGAWF